MLVKTFFFRGGTSLNTVTNDNEVNEWLDGMNDIEVVSIETRFQVTDDGKFVLMTILYEDGPSKKYPEGWDPGEGFVDRKQG